MKTQHKAKIIKIDCTISPDYGNWDHLQAVIYWSKPVKRMTGMTVSQIIDRPLMRSLDSERRAEAFIDLAETCNRVISAYLHRCCVEPWMGATTKAIINALYDRYGLEEPNEA